MNEKNILYEDNHIIVVFKEANILCQGDITKDVDLMTMIKKYLKEKYHKPGNVFLGLVHRLDRPVSGILVYAKTSKAASRLSKMVQNHEVKKEYLAICYGNINDSGTMTDYLIKRDGYSEVTNSFNGKLSELSYEVIDRKENLNLVKINLITGRHHQIRVQFSSRNYPLYGDQLYGKHDYKQIALCAYKLSFKHPVKEEIMTFKIEPKGKIWETFRKG